MIKLARNVGLQGLFGIGNHSMCTTSIHPDVTLDRNQHLANLGSYATHLLTQSLTESPGMNVDLRDIASKCVANYRLLRKIYILEKIHLVLVWVDIMLVG